MAFKRSAVRLILFETELMFFNLEKNPKRKQMRLLQISLVFE